VPQASEADAARQGAESLRQVGGFLLPSRHDGLEDLVKSFRDELREKLPRTSEAAASGKSRASAIKLHCIECMGGSVRDVYACNDRGCALYLYRPRRRDAQGPSVNPGDSALGSEIESGEGQDSGEPC
jgi:hypothetical protein